MKKYKGYHLFFGNIKINKLMGKKTKHECKRKQNK
jgi:hypothetical protein